MMHLHGTEKENIYLTLEEYDYSLHDNGSLEIEADDLWTLRKRAEVCCLLKKYGKALSDLNTLLDIQPNDAICIE